MVKDSTAQKPYTSVTEAFFTSVEAETDMPRLNRAEKQTRLTVKTTETYITASKKVTNSSQTTTSSSGRTYASDSMLKSASSSSTSHQNKKKNNASLTLNSKPVAKIRKGTKGPVQICNRYASWFMIIRRTKPYEIFLRMIHHLLWMSRHQEKGNRRPYLQSGVGRKCPKRSKTCPCSDSDNGTDHPMNGV